MTARHYLFGFSGRINRAKIWLWVLIAILFSMVMGIVAALGFDWSATMKALATHPPHTPLDWKTIPHPGCKGIISTVALVVIGLVWLAYAWAKLAIYAKRLHDRGRSAWWLLVYVVLPAVLTGVVYCPAASHVLPGSPVAKVIGLLTAVIGLWVFIDLYLLKGTTGSNKYGADPLEPNWCDPDKPAKGCTPKPMKD